LRFFLIITLFVSLIQSSDVKTDKELGELLRKERCLICQDSMVQDRLVVLPCNHAFHEQCINRWNTIRSLCPLCKKSDNRFCLSASTSKKEVAVHEVDRAEAAEKEYRRCCGLLRLLCLR
jgi:hypothetical protein